MKLTRHDKPITEHKGNRSQRDPTSIAGKARAKGLNPNTVYPRLKRMSLEDALAIPPMPQKESASLAGKASRAAARAKKAAKAVKE